ncbi:hypothetical protein [Flavobacterium fluviale]|uniref:Uncharacterized protein n=1 Tax=Flavobacterium fluviale TaxID=2249356 RepID=A0A344LUB8_9FLAO|nr:hypothetical protein [Flavobacterium fluviale]AXB57510.1 hypothetical protein HYN86_13255 [Flavobacterium fluviale]
MTSQIDIYETKFGQLILSHGPENDFVWSGQINEFPIYIFTKDRNLSNNTIEFVETIVSDIEGYIETSILFMKQTIIREREKYNIKENEYLIILDKNYCPVDQPEFIFYENSSEWSIRFAEGIFSICDPFGIAVTFKFKTPLGVDNLEDSEYID